MFVQTRICVHARIFLLTGMSMHIPENTLISARIGMFLHAYQCTQACSCTLHNLCTWECSLPLCNLSTRHVLAHLFCARGMFLHTYFVPGACSCTLILCQGHVPAHLFCARGLFLHTYLVPGACSCSFILCSGHVPAHLFCAIRYATTHLFVNLAYIAQLILHSLYYIAYIAQLILHSLYCIACSLFQQMVISYRSSNCISNCFLFQFSYFIIFSFRTY